MKSLISLVCLVLLAAEGWCCTPEAGMKFVNCAAAAGVKFDIQSLDNVQIMATDLCQSGVIDDVVECAQPLFAACKNANPIISTILSRFDLSKMGKAFKYGCDHLKELDSQLQCIITNTTSIGRCIEIASKSKTDQIISALTAGRPLPPELLHSYVCELGKAQDECISQNLGRCGNAASILTHISQEMRPDKCS